MSNKFIPNTFQTPNVIVDEMMYMLTPSEFQVLLFAIRHIIGWQDSISERKSQISLSMFTDGFVTRTGDVYRGCGLQIGAVRKALRSLESFNIIVRCKDDNGNYDYDNNGQWYQLPFLLGHSIDENKLLQRYKETRQADYERTKQATEKLKMIDKNPLSYDDTPTLDDSTPLSLDDSTPLSYDDTYETQGKSNENTNGASAKSNDDIHNDNQIDYDAIIKDLLSNEWLSTFDIAEQLDISIDDLTAIEAIHPAQIALEDLLRSKAIEYTLTINKNQRHYRLFQKSDKPRKQVSHRQSYIQAIENVTGIKAGKADEGLYYKTAKLLVESDIPLDDFDRHYKFVKSESKSQGDWSITVSSLTSNGRVSRSLAARDKAKSEPDYLEVWEFTG